MENKPIINDKEKIITVKECLQNLLSELMKEKPKVKEKSKIKSVN